MLIVAYGKAILDQYTVYRSYILFSESQEDVYNKERAGRPSTSTIDEIIDEVMKIIITVRAVAENLNISIGLCHLILPIIWAWDGSPRN